MFELITSKMGMLDVSEKLVRKEAPDQDIDMQSAARLSYTYPCFADLFIGYNLSRTKQIVNGHVCHIKVAKCLTYPKTNKPNNFCWFLVSKADDIPSVLGKSLLFGGNTEKKIIKAYGFHKELRKVCVGEPFLLTALTFFGKANDMAHKIHISMMSKDTAKRLVYYKKDMAPMMEVCEEAVEEAVGPDLGGMADDMYMLQNKKRKLGGRWVHVLIGNNYKWVQE